MRSLSAREQPGICNKKIMMEGNKEQRQQLEDQEKEKMSEIPEPNLDEEPKSFQYEEPSILASSARAYMESENALLLKDLEEIIDHEEKKIQYYKDKKEAVSYTHLTLPTILLVQISVVAVSLKKKKIKQNKQQQIEEQQIIKAQKHIQITQQKYY
eukprot:TRINITY_DN6499_c0_g1_i1.p1 TRINITY_DN6499_c0_g1~~TRINITY_DN6499_c0_g1_i1.p1  ORF type:complete len:156 (+),score=33.52 TRINITY_DN6499_c0_g1_i1:251-718(+)